MPTGSAHPVREFEVLDRFGMTVAAALSSFSWSNHVSGIVP